MSPIDLDRLFESFQPDRREFLRSLILGTAYATPLVASFSMDGLVAPAGAQAGNLCAGSNVGSNTADLAITKTASPEPVVAGEQLTYALTVANCGPADADDVLVEDQLPPGATFVSAAQTSGATTFSLTTPAVGEEAGVFQATAASMPEGDVAVFVIVVQVNP
jgi:uncharacterized repeat protein (TIGR01451 family)